MADSLKKVLVANRGIIAKRIMRTCKELGIGTIGIYTEDDLNLNSLVYADEIFKVDDLNDKSGYMNAQAIIKLAVENDAAIHPGYGFLSENYDFSEKCLRDNIKFIGPSPEILKIAGNKILCNMLLNDNNIPIIESVFSSKFDKQLLEKLENIGFPFLIKPAYGGGGIGMAIVERAEDLEIVLTSVINLSEKYFGYTDVLIEKYLPDAKHIEVQLIADQHGNITHLFERECSMQRRKQKVIEESPSPSINDIQRKELYQLAINIGKVIKLDNIATIEFLLYDNKFYFLEINPRLQVEHAVTEELTGIDLVDLQIKSASGAVISNKLIKNSMKKNKHVIEVRVYAEDPLTHLPAPGNIDYLELPDGYNIRIESCLDVNTKISEKYDPMLMKIITSGKNRDLAIKRMMQALAGLDINSFDSLQTNTMSLINALSSDEFIDKTYNTNSYEKYINFNDNVPEKEIFEVINESINIKKKTKFINQQNSNSSFWQPAFWQKR